MNSPNSLSRKNRGTQLLSRDEERLLSDSIQAGKQAQARIDAGRALSGDSGVVERGRVARRRFMEANVGLVVSVARRQSIPSHVDFDDVIQDGMVGLGRAIDDFDASLGWKFSTYAVWWIRRAVQVGLENSVSTVRIPEHRMRDLRIARSELEPNELTALQVQTQTMLTMGSLDVPVRAGASLTAGEAIASDAPLPEVVLVADADRRAVKALLSGLDPKNAELVVARFGLDGQEPKTYTELAEHSGVTPEAIRKRVRRALGHMRDRAEEMVAA